MMRLSELAREVGGTVHGADVDIHGITVDSRTARPGDLFVAMRGARSDGLAFAADARARGASAVCAAEPVDGGPTLIVSNARTALPTLAAALHGHPARGLRLVGVTGTLGKTSTALLLQAAISADGDEVGVIGSLGVRANGWALDTGMTTPEAPAIHGALRQMVGAGIRRAVIEVSSHGIALGRVDGLRFALGVFTNLVPDEHLEFHRTPDDYVATKARFFAMLEPGAPLVIDHDDVRLAAEARRAGHEVVGVSMAGAPEAAVVVESAAASAAGAAGRLRVTRPLVGWDGVRVAPGCLPLTRPALGLAQLSNAALAATGALLTGAAPAAVARALAAAPTARRRMEVVRDLSPVVVDDTVGNPRSVLAAFDAVRPLPRETLRIAFGMRGARGTLINERLAQALGAAVRDAASAGAPVHLVVTSSEDAAGPRDRVLPAERDGFLAALAGTGVRFEYEPTVAGAVAQALDGWSPHDVVLLLGAQGMDTAADVARRVLDG